MQKGAPSAYQSQCAPLLHLREVGAHSVMSTVGRLAVLFARGLPYLICSLTQGQCAGEPEASFSGGSSAAVRMPRISRTPVQHLRGGYQSALKDLTSLTIRVRRMHHSVMQGQARSQAHGISLAGLKAE